MSLETKAHEKEPMQRAMPPTSIVEKCGVGCTFRKDRTANLVKKMKTVMDPSLIQNCVPN